MLTFYAYHNVNWFPENKKQFTVKIYYKSGRTDVKTFNLPQSTKISLKIQSNRSNITSIWYHNNKPFGMEYGYLALDAEDYEIINIK